MIGSDKFPHRHCEKRSDEAIQWPRMLKPAFWIAAHLAMLAMTLGIRMTNIYHTRIPGLCAGIGLIRKDDPGSSPGMLGLRAKYGWGAK